MRAVRILIVLAIASCSRPAAPPQVKPDPVDATPPVIKSAAPAPKQPAFCSTDKDCDYDDPCNAHACVAKTAGPRDCDKSAAPPGPCICGMHECTLMRKVPSAGAVKTGCKSNAECAFIASTGSCVAGTPETFIEKRGGFCVCDAGTCTPEFVDAVACKTSADCSFLENPMRPVPASKVPRPFPPITPCKTGERDSVCEKGQCVIRVWPC
jgi:hypothetical protein